ncbi:short-chain dehydrogenase [Mariannaea sp. PMI_226]|nr:short-chain dehydrogenase [Mariannaea sp. PMI_226]
MSMTYDECRVTRPARPAPTVADNVMEQFKMSDRVCIITGASRGIGAAVAEGLAEAGAHIVLVYSTENPYMEQKASDLAQRHGVRVLNIMCDVTDPTAVMELVSRVLNSLGKIDVFIANAGICNPKPILEQSLEEYHAEMDVNVHGVVHCAKAVGPVFKEQGFGNFIITTSISGSVVTVPMDHTTYNTTKAAAIHLGKSLAREWRDFARVNMVSPGWIDTAMNKDLPSIHEANRMSVLGRTGHVKEMKGAYLFLASDASSFVTGAEILVDGGYTLP